jgi:hypothetical protein
LFSALTYNFKWTDITYDTPTLDIKDIKVEFVDVNGLGEIKVHFPALKKFDIHAIQNVDSWTVPNDEKITFKWEDFNIDFSASLHVNSEGNLKP